MTEFLPVERGFDETIDEWRRKGWVTVEVAPAQPYGSKIVGRLTLTPAGVERFGDLDTVKMCDYREGLIRAIHALRGCPRAPHELDLDRYGRRLLRKMSLASYDRSAGVWFVRENPPEKRQEAA